MPILYLNPKILLLFKALVEKPFVLIKIRKILKEYWCGIKKYSLNAEGNIKTGFFTDDFLKLRSAVNWFL